MKGEVVTSVIEIAVLVDGQVEGFVCKSSRWWYFVLSC